MNETLIKSRCSLYFGYSLYPISYPINCNSKNCNFLDLLTIDLLKGQAFIGCCAMYILFLYIPLVSCSKGSKAFHFYLGFN